jgi:hypothetical protein
MTYSGGDGVSGTSAQNSSSASPVNDVIGDTIGAAVSDPRNSIQSVTWTVTPISGSPAANEYSDQLLLYRTGFVNTAMNFTAVTGTGVSFSWGQNPGMYKITATCHYSQSAAATTDVVVNLSEPVGKLTPTSTGTPYISATAGSGMLYSGNPAGITYQEQVDMLNCPAVSGRFGVIQTLSSYFTEAKKTVGNTIYVFDSGVSMATGAPTYPRPLVDDDPQGAVAPATFYLGNFGEATGGTITTYPEGDRPQLGLDPNFASYSMSVNFKMDLMFQVNNGIWVPLGYMTWSVNMGADRNAALPSGWALSYIPISTTAYTASTSYPLWAESMYYLDHTWGYWVQTSP